jgi:hypothetical protein
MGHKVHVAVFPVLLNFAGTIQLKMGAHAPSRKISTLASDHQTVCLLTPLPTGEGTGRHTRGARMLPVNSEVQSLADRKLTSGSEAQRAKEFRAKGGKGANDSKEFESVGLLGHAFFTKQAFRAMEMPSILQSIS